MALVKILISELKELKEMYRVKWPLHIMTYNNFKNLIERFEKHPKWKSKAVFWSLNGEWGKHGTFIMTYGNLIFFNTLEPAPYNEIEQALMLVNYGSFTMFTDIREIFRTLIYNVIEKLQLRVVSEEDFLCYFIPKELFQNISIM